MAPTAALAYHAVTDQWPNPLAVSTDSFRAQIHGLAERGLHGVTLADVARGGRRDAIGVTFDDGFTSVAAAAKPILDELGWTATVFVVTDAVGRAEPMLWLGGSKADHAGERLPLRWDELDALAAAGWEIGSHGRTHRLLSTLDDEDLDEELRTSKEALEQHGFACTSISYPYGELDDRVIGVAARVGYTVGSGLAGRFRPSDPMCIPRVAISGADGRLRFALKTSRFFLAARRTAAWTCLESIRRAGHPLGI